MTDTMYVLDASALLAAFFKEAGADAVAQRMSGAIFSTINLSEVVAKLVEPRRVYRRPLDVSHAAIEMMSAAA